MAPDSEGLRWRKSTRSATNGACVEIAELTGAVAVRDSKDPQGPRLRFDLPSWRAFVAGVQAGVFDQE
jgi:Domain of unknown function (DUF397)